MDKKGRVMSAHQPNFLPYLGFFDKMMRSDVFVIRDECQFSKREFHERNKIRINGIDKETGGPNWRWLTVPIPKNEIDLKEIPIKNEVMEKGRPWDAEMVRQIQINYEGTSFFEQYFPGLEKVLLDRKNMLIDLSLNIIYFLRDAFNLNADIVLASILPGYNKSGDPIQDLASLAKITGADIYLSGQGGMGYLSTHAPFTKEGIEVRFQQYKHPVYPQRWPGFLPNMASIDALFNVGPEIILEGEKERIQKVPQIQEA